MAGQDMLSALPVMKTALIKSLPVLPVRGPTAKLRGLFGRLWKCGTKSRVLTVRNTGERSCADLLISITLEAALQFERRYAV